MSNSKLPTEVELIYEVMPCIAMRTAQEPHAVQHPCTYFRKWGAYHSYDYDEKGPPHQPGIQQPSDYVGLAKLTPEVLSGCRKSPIFVVGINPNLTGYVASRKNSVYPLFDEYKQYAHYFRYRSTDKLQIPKDKFAAFGGTNDEVPPMLETDLNVPETDGRREIPLELQPVTYYHELQKLLDDMAAALGWNDHQLTVGEDISYGNMVACPSARWLTSPDAKYPGLEMSSEENAGIVNECFHSRKYFLRQLFQSLPKIIMVVGATTSKPFISALKGRFIEGNPKVSEGIDALMSRKHVLKYGELPDGTELTARVIFSRHITGDPIHFKATRAKVLAQLVEEAKAGTITLNANSGHLLRPKGACVFCPMLEIGKCDYENELVPITDHPVLTADSSSVQLFEEKKAQLELMNVEPPSDESYGAEVWKEDLTDYQTDDI
ncbi:MAG: hypothetical protein NTW29_01905 [Bacteroidetes bacterium]|nr:hypothetical protein [Bacteroidota bacterium]